MHGKLIHYVPSDSHTHLPRSNMYCMCEDAACLNAGTPCPFCDDRGYPIHAHRRLKRAAKDRLEDIDDGQRFRVRTTKHGDRLVPVFQKRISWSKPDGYEAMKLFLSCLGTEGEYVLWDETREMDENAWTRNEFGIRDCPPILHKTCDEVVTTTSIDSLSHGRNIGCKCHISAIANHWRGRRPEIVALEKERKFKVLTTEEKWIRDCPGKEYCPELKCLDCNEVVTTTCITNLIRRGIGCGCRNKTEAKLREWLLRQFPNDTIVEQYRGPDTIVKGHTHFDFHLSVKDGVMLFIELDGAQHFWKNTWHFKEEGCDRDVIKESWATERGISVVRVLQEDVWEDKYNWQGWIIQCVQTAMREKVARVFTPDTKEYRSKESAYVQRKN